MDVLAEQAFNQKCSAVLVNRDSTLKARHLLSLLRSGLMYREGNKSKSHKNCLSLIKATGA